MNESQRVAYLKAMGIDQYYPRRVLPQAKPSPIFQFDPAPESSEPKTSRPDTPVKPAQKSAGSDKGQRQQASPPPRVVADTPKETVAPEKPASKPQRARGFSFKLEYFPVHKDLAVIADRPPQSSGDQQQQAMELLLAILRAVLPEEQDKLPPALDFSWPLSAEIGLDSSPDQAAKALQGFLRSKQEQDGFSNLLVFTEILGSLLVHDKASQQNHAVQFTGRDLQLTLCHGLHSMLAVPALKRDTWQALQGLRGRLQIQA